MRCLPLGVRLVVRRRGGADEQEGNRRIPSPGQISAAGDKTGRVLVDRYHPGKPENYITRARLVTSRRQAKQPADNGRCPSIRGKHLRVKQSVRVGAVVVGIVVVVAAALVGFAYRGRVEAAFRNGVLAASGKQIAVGKPFPAIDLVSPAGAPLRYAPAQGKITIVNVFATWCPPCRAESPDYARFAKSPAADGVDITAIDRAETAPQIEAYRKKYGLTFPYLIDDGNDSRDVLGARAMPVTIVVDARGIVRADVAGPVTAERLAALTEQAKQPL